MTTLETFFHELLAPDCAQARVVGFRVTFGAKRKKSQRHRRVTLRPLGEDQVQFEYFTDTQAFHKNMDRETAHAEVLRLCAEEFKQIDGQMERLSGTGIDREEFQILASKPDSPRIVRRSLGVASADSACEPAAPRAATHDRRKRYLLVDGVPVDFLVRLDVSDARGKVHPRSYAKFRQINRFLEIVDDVYRGGGAPTDQPIRVIDFGCGKAYLTFALYYYFTRILRRPAEIIGLDLKRDVIDFCSEVARDLGYEGLRFEYGDIADYPESSVDLMVSLHACDTATDYAIAQAVRWGARTILSVPCCQHELFSQLKNDLHRPLLKHGILKDKMTELLTDSLRGLKLESLGYEVSMIEFTSLEHTAKNTMIRAVKRSTESERARVAASDAARLAEAQFQALIDFWRIDPTIARILP
ncbi:MAG: SAM-dependent methyltransferase [Bacillota bacterium]|nr:SAM-dependent methyltransferase [Bacillota bacterium]